MSHGKMSDFVSIHLFRFTLLIKLRNFDFKSYWNFLIIFDKETVLLDLTMSDLWTLTVSSCVIRFRCLSHGLTVGSSFHRFTIFEWIFSQTHRFLKKKKQTNKQTQAAHSSAAEERISRMINKNKASSRSSLYLSRKLLFIKLKQKTHW